MFSSAVILGVCSSVFPLIGLTPPLSPLFFGGEFDIIFFPLPKEGDKKANRLTNILERYKIIVHC